jgi:hypothetical protein
MIMKKIYFILIALMITSLSFGQTYSSGTQTGQTITPPDPGASKFVRLKVQNLHTTGYAGIVFISGSDTAFLQVDQTGKLVISSFTTNGVTANSASTFKGNLYIVHDGDSSIINMGTGIRLLDLRANSATMFFVDSTGKVVTAGTINGQTISSAASFTGSLAITGALTGVTTLATSSTVNGLTIANGVEGLTTTATAVVHTDSTNAVAQLAAVNSLVTVTSASAAYIIALPACSANFVGGVIRIFVGATGYKLRLKNTDEIAGSKYLNNAQQKYQITMAANTLATCIQLSATQWVVTATDYAGTVQTVTPASF